MRGVCKRTGLAARYFYESFTDRDALAVAVFDHVVSDLATTTLDAVKDAPEEARAKIRAGLANIVHRIAEDPRIGRLLFSPALNTTVLLQRRTQRFGVISRPRRVRSPRGNFRRWAGQTERTKYIEF